MDGQTSAAGRSGRWREIALRSLLAIVSVLLTLGVAEAVVRLAGIGRDMPPAMADKRYLNFSESIQSRPVLVEFPGILKKQVWAFRYKPGSTWGTGYRNDDRRIVEPRHRMVYRLNNEGFRGDDFTRRKPEGTYRIAVAGDSFTFGEGVATEATFAELIERNLAGRGVEVLNLGVNGYDAIDVMLLLNEVVPDFRPDLVIYGHVLNDISRDEMDRLSDDMDLNRERLAFLRHSPLRLFRIAGRRIEAAVADRATMNAYRRLYRSPEQWRAHTTVIDAMRASVEQSGGRFAVAVFPDLAAWSGKRYRLGWLHDQLNTFLDGAGIDHLDLADAFPDADKRRYWVDASDPHPNETAHRIIADRLVGLVPAEVSL